MSSTFCIGDRQISRDSKPFCIAEVGINHNGSIALAKQMVVAAKAAGADAVKFQTFKAEEFCGDAGQMFTYRSQGRSITEPMLEMFRRYEFSCDQWRDIKSHCDSVGIVFFSTPQNRSDLTMLLDVGVQVIKVGSDDFNNLPLLQSYSATGLPLILSCGMSDLAEVHQALDIAGWFAGHPVVLLLCTSQYPTPPEDVNITKLTTLQQAFPGLIVGFSDHTQGPLAASLAVALGARVFEKHFTLDHNLPGPDHWFSEDVAGLTEWIANIHRAHCMLGRPYIRPTDAEQDNRREFRRVIVAAADIHAGDIFTETNLTMRRVAGGQGLPPALFWRLLGRTAPRDYTALSPIDL
jgi:N-acetylneuraminate synthase/N,N'-diacetyllegionaminate synthase